MTPERQEEMAPYPGPLVHRLDSVERRVDRIEDRTISTTETLVRLEERTAALAGDIADIKSDVSGIRGDVRREVTTIKRFFYSLGAAFTLVAIGVIVDLATRA